jgi:hypothetical protein
MIRVHVICEGQTEEMFINEALSKLLAPMDIYLYPSMIGKPGHKGGNVCFQRLLTDLRVRLLDDHEAYSTTFFDFYGLPTNFPGKDAARQKNNIAEKSACLLDALSEALKAKLGASPLRRFIPYVQMHEFEGLLFSDVDALARGINQNSLRHSFKAIRDQFNSPEEINDSPSTAPSKRIGALFPAYDKPLHGSLATLETGLDAIRRECALFDGWVKQLEALAPQKNR